MDGLQNSTTDLQECNAYTIRKSFKVIRSLDIRNHRGIADSALQQRNALGKLLWSTFSVILLYQNNGSMSSRR